MQEEELYAECGTRLNNFFLSKLLCIFPSLFAKNHNKARYNIYGNLLPVFSTEGSHLEEKYRKPLYWVIQSRLKDLPSHSHGHLPLGIMKRIRRYHYECHIFFIFIPKWQTSRANVMSSLKTLNKLPRKRAFSAGEKWTVRSTGVGGFISPENGNLRR